MRHYLISLVHPWPPISAFASVAIVYLMLNALMGTHLDFAVQFIALAVLFVATPISAVICRRIASARKRLPGCWVAGVACAVAWMAMMSIHFHGEQEIGPYRYSSRIALGGAFSVSLYAPLIWLACGGARRVTIDGALAADLKAARRTALACATFWLLVGAALAIAPPLVLLDAGDWWGPMSLFTGPVAGVLCALGGIRDARAAGRVAFWVLFAVGVALILRMIYIGVFFLMVSGWIH